MKEHNSSTIVLAILLAIAAGVAIWAVNKEPVVRTVEVPGETKVVQVPGETKVVQMPGKTTTVTKTVYRDRPVYINHPRSFNNSSLANCRVSTHERKNDGKRVDAWVQAVRVKINALCEQLHDKRETLNRVNRNTGDYTAKELSDKRYELKEDIQELVADINTEKHKLAEHGWL